MVEVRGVEPLSETESTKHLRVYLAFNLGKNLWGPRGGVKIGVILRCFVELSIK